MTSQLAAPGVLGAGIEIETPLKRWHPKLTPYRLLVLSTTIGLGTAKTITAASQSTFASITLEWVSSVVVFLILQSLSTYDAPGSAPPALLSWMFTVDCMDSVWRFLGMFSVVHPVYDSNEELDYSGERWSRRPLITLYRLLVCTVVMSFGITKGVLAYIGYSMATNWIDWSLGVLVTTMLYCIGLYENNSARMWREFFVTDYSSSLNFAGRVLGRGIAVLLSATWIILSVFLVRYAIWFEWNDPNAPADAPTAYLERGFTAYGQDRSVRVVLTTCALFAMASGGYVLLACLRSFRGVVGGRFAVRYRWFRALRALVNNAMAVASAAVSAIFATRDIRWKTSFRILAHIALHLAGLAFSIALAFFWLGFVSPALEDPAWLMPTIGLLVMTCASAILALVIGLNMLLPWFIYRNSRGRPDWERALLSM